MNNSKTNKGDCCRSVFVGEDREKSDLFLYASFLRRNICSAQYNGKYISITLRPLYSRHKDNQQRHRDSWWFSNRVYSSFLSLVKRWQIHLISVVRCYMNFTGETLFCAATWAWNLNPLKPNWSIERQIKQQPGVIKSQQYPVVVV